MSVTFTNGLQGPRSRYLLPGQCPGPHFSCSPLWSSPPCPKAAGPGREEPDASNTSGRHVASTPSALKRVATLHDHPRLPPLTSSAQGSESQRSPCEAVPLPQRGGRCVRRTERGSLRKTTERRRGQLRASSRWAMSRGPVSPVGRCHRLLAEVAPGIRQSWLCGLRPNSDVSGGLRVLEGAASQGCNGADTGKPSFCREYHLSQAGRRVHGARFTGNP